MDDDATKIFGSFPVPQEPDGLPLHPPAAGKKTRGPRRVAGEKKTRAKRVPRAAAPEPQRVAAVDPKPSASELAVAMLSFERLLKRLPKAERAGILAWLGGES